MDKEEIKIKLTMAIKLAHTIIPLKEIAEAIKDSFDKEELEAIKKDL